MAEIQQLERKIAEGGTYYVLEDRQNGYVKKFDGHDVKWTNDRMKAWTTVKSQRAHDKLDEIREAHKGGSEWVVKGLFVTER